MNWKTKLESYEVRQNWSDAIKLLEQVIFQNPFEAEPRIRMIYLLHNLLVEGGYRSSEFNHDQLATLLLYYFKESLLKFKSNGEFAFFIGIILHIAEWYFGQDDISLALELQKEATEIEPENVLYRFSYEFSKGNRKIARLLANQLMQDSHYLKWLGTKGFPGKYVIGIIESVYKGRISGYNVYDDS